MPVFWLGIAPALGGARAACPGCPWTPGPHADAVTEEMSGGALQRFCIARALWSDTRYIGADEMKTMFDAVIQAQIWHTLIDIVRDRELGLLVISHPASSDALLMH